MFDSTQVQALMEGVRLGEASVHEGALVIATPQAFEGTLSATVNDSDGQAEPVPESEIAAVIQRALAGEVQGTLKVRFGEAEFLQPWRAAFPGARVQANLFISRKTVRGIRPHYDDHHVFAIQLLGQKDWGLGGVVDVVSPERPSRYPRVDPTIKTSTSTRPGDVLYMPSGEWHSTATPGDLSAHLTVGVFPATVAHVLRESARLQAEVDPLLRSELPMRSEGGRHRAQLPSRTELLEIARRAVSVRTCDRQTLAANLETEDDTPSRHDEVLDSVLARSTDDSVLAVYGRGSSALRDPEREPWDLDFLVVHRSEAEVGAALELERGIPRMIDDGLEIDVKHVSADALASSSMGVIRRLDVGSDGVLLWGSDVVRRLGRPEVTDDVIEGFWRHSLRIAQGNVEALGLGDLEQRRAAKSVLRLGAPFLLKTTGSLDRRPRICAGELALNVPDLVIPLRDLLRALAREPHEGWDLALDAARTVVADLEGHSGPLGRRSRG